MIEKIILDYLNKVLDVPVYMERPAQKPDRYVLIEKTGGSEKSHIQTATLALQSYAESLYQAAVLNELLKGAMMESITLPQVSRAKLNSDYNYTDTTKKEYRYQAVYDLVVME